MNTTAGMAADSHFTVLIPARMASSRLPHKPLADIAGLPMVVRVAQRAQQSAAQRVVVAADDARILDACKQHGIQAVLTSANHLSGSDRLAEACDLLQLGDSDIVVNVQGDEPLIPPVLIDQVAANLAANPQAGIATLAEPIEDVQALFNPNVVKVVSDKSGLALTFSRAPIAWARDAFAVSRERLPAAIPYRRHIGIYAYRAGFLHDFVAWGPCWLEDTECLEQLRALWNGVRIHVADALQSPPAGVDTAEDLARVRRLLEG